MWTNDHLATLITPDHLAQLAELARRKTGIQADAARLEDRIRKADGLLQAMDARVAAIDAELALPPEPVNTDRIERMLAGEEPGPDISAARLKERQAREGALHAERSQAIADRALLSSTREADREALEALRSGDLARAQRAMLLCLADGLVASYRAHMIELRDVRLRAMDAVRRAVRRETPGYAGFLETDLNNLSVSWFPSGPDAYGARSIWPNNSGLTADREPFDCPALVDALLALGAQASEAQAGG